MQQDARQAGVAGAVGGQSPNLPTAQSSALDDGPDALAYAFGGKLAAALLAGGYGSLAAVQAASDAALH